MKTRPSHTADEQKSPQIVWDGLGLSNEHSGVGSYGKNLYLALGLLGVFPKVVVSSASDVQYVPAADQIGLGAGAQFNFSKRLIQLKPVYPVYGYHRARSEASKNQDASSSRKGMIYHGLSNINLPCFGRKLAEDRFVITVHDIIPLLVRENSALALQMRVLMPRVLDKADHIITGSKWAKETVLSHFGMKYSGKISAVGYGTEVPAETVANVASKTIDGLSIARGESYKRLEMIEAIARKHPHYKFAVVTCHAGRRRLAEAPTNLKVHVQLTRWELENLFSSSKIFIHPSLFEGWCLPAADALMRGLHVLYCTGSGIDEIFEGHSAAATGLPRSASLVDWCEAFSAAITALKPAENIGTLKKWSEVAQKTLQIYQSLV